MGFHAYFVFPSKFTTHFVPILFFSFSFMKHKIHFILSVFLLCNPLLLFVTHPFRSMAEYLLMRNYLDMKEKLVTAEVQCNHARESLNRFGEFLEKTRSNKERFINIKKRLEMEALLHFKRDSPFWRDGFINISRSQIHRGHLILIANNNGISKNQRNARAHNRFKQYIRKFSDARSTERRYNIVRNSLFQFEQRINMPVVVETLQETKTLGSLWENFNNNSVSVIIPPSASKEVTFSLAMTKGFKHLHIHWQVRIRPV